MKKILFVSLHSPFEAYSGGHQRTALLYDALRRRYAVDLVCFTQIDPLPESLNDSAQSIKYFGGYPVKPASSFHRISNLLRSASPFCLADRNAFCEEILRQLVQRKRYDYIVVRYLRTAIMANVFHLRNLVVDVDDLSEEVLRAYADQPNLPLLKSLYRRFLVWRARFHTGQILSRIHHSFFSNSNQALFLNSSHLPNIPFPRTTDAPVVKMRARQHIVLFVGFLGYKPNYLGVDHFIRHVWPEASDGVEEAVFRVIGKGLPQEYERRWARVRGVEVVGYVDDIEWEYFNAEAVVAPIYHGGGTNIKVLEAMSKSKACVMSAFARRGLEDAVSDGWNSLVATNDAIFIEKLRSVLTDRDLRARIESNAAKCVKAAYSFERFAEDVYKALD